MGEVSKQYAERDVMALDRAGGYYSRHVRAMTAEGLQSKSDIAAELAWRDAEIERLRSEASDRAAQGGVCEGTEAFGDYCARLWSQAVEQSASEGSCAEVIYARLILSNTRDHVGPSEMVIAAQGGGEQFLQEVCDELAALDCGACVGSMAPFEDLHGRIRAYLATRPAAEAVGVPDGWRVMWFTGSFRSRGERWEIYGPDGSGGAVSAGDVVDESVSHLLDAMAAAAPSQPEGRS